MFNASCATDSDLLTSSLLDQDTFYPRFMRDLEHCNFEVIIESPFITSRRLISLLPAFGRLRRHGVSIVINTKHPGEHDDDYLRYEARYAVDELLYIGVKVLFTGGHHRKLAILDRRILFEGSLNILSQGDSCEIMRRIESEALAQQMVEFTKLNKYL